MSTPPPAGGPQGPQYPNNAQPQMTPEQFQQYQDFQRFQQANGSTPTQQPKKKRGGCLKLILGFLALVVLVIILAVACTGGGGNDTSDTNNTNETSQSSAESSEEAADDGVPAEYKSALNKADSYANGMDMSKAAVQDQLTSEYGEQFTAEEAAYAVENLNQ